MKALRTLFLLLFFSLGLSQAQSAPTQSQPVSPDVIDLHRGECTEVHLGSRIHFTFRMAFDGTVPSSQQPETRPSFVNAQQRQLGLENILVKKIAEADVWEFYGDVSKLSSKGEYQMNDLWSRYNLGYDPAVGTVFAYATLTPEAKQEIAAYRVCLKDGGAPVPTGKITSVGPPEK